MSTENQEQKRARAQEYDGKGHQLANQLLKQMTKLPDPIRHINILNRAAIHILATAIMNHSDQDYEPKQQIMDIGADIAMTLQEYSEDMKESELLRFGEEPLQ